VLLPAQLLGVSSIEKSAVIIGCETHAEIWAEQIYDEKFGATDYDSISEMLRGYGL
jgi:DNA-binding transcriptional regulator/RsmH inhibitor MraZ